MRTHALSSTPLSRRLSERSPSFSLPRGRPLRTSILLGDHEQCCPLLLTNSEDIPSSQFFGVSRLAQVATKSTRVSALLQRQVTEVHHFPRTKYLIQQLNQERPACSQSPIILKSQASLPSAECAWIRRHKGSEYILCGILNVGDDEVLITHHSVKQKIHILCQDSPAFTSEPAQKTVM